MEEEKSSTEQEIWKNAVTSIGVLCSLIWIIPGLISLSGLKCNDCNTNCRDGYMLDHTQMVKHGFWAAKGTKNIKSCDHTRDRASGSKL